MSTKNRHVPITRPLPAVGLSETRAYRLNAGVRLMDVSCYSGISLTRLSEIERFADRARIGELEVVRETVDRIVAERKRLAKSGGAA
jgi:hypothetical protein